MPYNLLFAVQLVRLELPEWEMPGPPRRHAVCAHCGQIIRDGKEIYNEDEILCGPCDEESYFVSIAKLSPHRKNGLQQKEL